MGYGEWGEGKRAARVLVEGWRASGGGRERTKQSNMNLVHAWPAMQGCQRRVAADGGGGRAKAVKAACIWFTHLVYARDGGGLAVGLRGKGEGG